MQHPAAQVIDTGRLELLPLRVEHAAEMAGVLADPALHTFIGGEPADADALRERYQRLGVGSPDPAVAWLNWVIRLREDDCLTGYLQASVSAGDDQHPIAEVAWVVGTGWQGRSIATESVRALVDWLREQSVGTVIAHVHPDHQASAAVAAAGGLTPTDEREDGEVRWRRVFDR